MYVWKPIYFLLGKALTSVSHGYVSRYIHDMRAAVFFVLIFRIKIVVVGAVEMWITLNLAYRGIGIDEIANVDNLWITHIKVWINRDVSNLEQKRIVIFYLTCG